MNVSEYSRSRVPASSNYIANVGVENRLQTRRSTFHNDAWNDLSSKQYSKARNEQICTHERKPEINTSFHCFSRNFGQIPKGGNVVHQAYRNAAFYPKINSKMDPSSILRHILNSRESERQNRVFPNNDHAVNLPDIGRSIPSKVRCNTSRRPISSSGLKVYEKAAEIPFSRWVPSDREVKSAGQMRVMKSKNRNPSCRAMLTTADTKFDDISKRISDFEKRSNNAVESSKFPKRRKSSNIKSKEKNGLKFTEKVITKRRLVPTSLDTGQENSHDAPIRNKKAHVTRWVRQTEPKEITSKAKNTCESVRNESRSNHCDKQLNKLNHRKHCFCVGSNNQNETIKHHCWSRHLDGNWSFGTNILANGALLNGSRQRNCSYCLGEKTIAPGNYVFGFCDRGSHNLGDLTAEHGEKLYTTNAKFQSVSRQNSLTRAEDNIDNNHLNGIKLTQNRENYGVSSFSHISRTDVRRHYGIRQFVLGAVTVLIVTVAIFSIVYHQMLQ